MQTWPGRTVSKSGHPNRLEREGVLWEITTMQAVKIDKQKRVRLKIFTPGDLYQPDFTTPEVITLRRIEPPKPKTKMTAAEVKAALSKITVKARSSWEEIRKNTREL